MHTSPKLSRLRIFSLLSSFLTFDFSVVYAFGFVGKGWKLASSTSRHRNSIGGFIVTPRFDSFRRITTDEEVPPVSITILRSSPSPSEKTRVDLKQILADSLYKQQYPNKDDDGQDRSALPVFDVLELVGENLVSKPNLLLQAAPGAGKTTIVPLKLLLGLLEEEELSSRTGNESKQILVVAPRRVAVRSAAQRMTKLIGEKFPGGTIGYAMRDEVKVGSSTRIKVVTDGVLLNLLREDPELRGIGLVVLDEFHERGVGSDTCLALLRQVQQTFREDDLKIVVMSATLLGNNNESSGDEVVGESSSTGSKLLRVLGGPLSCGIVESEGRQFPVKLRWANEVVQNMSNNNRKGGGKNGIPPLGSLLGDRKSLIETAANVVERSALKQAPNRGDVLVFLPGAAECRRVVRELLSRNTVANNADVVALYGTMLKEDQDRVLYPSKQRVAAPTHNDGDRRQRVIVSTPIAEASLTIPGVTCVVDCGLRREPRCDIDTGLSRLVTTRISRASAIQRMGRAGRVQEGSCLRLYTEANFERDFLEQSTPEIASTDLAPILLLLADWGVSTLSEILHEMPFVDPPEQKSLERAEQFLIKIGALEKTDTTRFKLTELGRKISKMPCHPRLAVSISKAISRENDDHTLLAASIAVAFCLDDETSFNKSTVKNDDPNLAYAIQFIAKNVSMFPALQRFAGRVGGSRGRAAIQAFQADENDFIRRAIANLGMAMLPGFADLVGERKGDASFLSSDYYLALGKPCVLGWLKSPEYILALETYTGPDGICRVSSYVSITKDLLENNAVDRTVIYTVPSKGYQVRARQVKAIGSIELSSSPLPSPPQQEISDALMKAMNKDLGGIANALLMYLAPNDKSRVEELIARIRLDKELSREKDWPLCFEAFDTHGFDPDTRKKILTELIEPWIGSVKSLKELKTLDILRSVLSPEQQNYLDEFYPTSIDAPDGSMIPVRYTRQNIDRSNDEEGFRASYRPMATAKLQQFLGARETPSIGRSKPLPLTLSLVSPAGKPLAETSDLPFFWSEVYPSIRSEMRGKYPKHPWPEDPLVAVATKKTKKQLSNNEAGVSESKPKRKGKGRRKRKKK